MSFERVIRYACEIRPQREPSRAVRTLSCKLYGFTHAIDADSEGDKLNHIPASRLCVWRQVCIEFSTLTLIVYKATALKSAVTACRLVHMPILVRYRIERNREIIDGESGRSATGHDPDGILSGGSIAP